MSDSSFQNSKIFDSQVSLLMFPLLWEPWKPKLTLQQTVCKTKKPRIRTQTPGDVCSRGPDLAGAEPAEGDVVPGGGRPPGVLGEESEEALQGPPEEQPGSPDRPERPKAAHGVQEAAAAAPRQSAGETTL